MKISPLKKLLYTGPQLLNCQMQSHFSWLVVSPLGQKKVLSKAIWCRMEFHPFRPPLHCHNSFVAIKTTVSATIYHYNACSR